MITTNPPPVTIRPAEATARSITGRDYLSYSQVDSFRRCPRKFAFSYVEQVEPEFVPVSLVFGSAIHAALEHHFELKLAGSPSDRQMLIECYHDYWDREASEPLPIRLGKSQTEQDLHELAGRMIDGFLESDLADLQGDIIAIEQPLRATVDSELPDILGRADLIWQSSDSLHVVDFKTARSKWSQDKLIESSDQLNLYGRLAQDMATELRSPVQLQFAVLPKTKQPELQLLDVHPSSQRAEYVIEVIRQVWSAIQQGHFYPVPSAMNCGGCPFKSACRAWAHA